MESRWNDLTVSALKKKCEERSLPKSGLKPDLIKRIQDHDKRSHPQPSQTPKPQRRRSDYYRPQYDNVRQGISDIHIDRDQRSPENVRCEISNRGHLRSSLPTQAHQLIEAFQDDPGDSTAAKLTEEQLESICRKHYWPWAKDPRGEERTTVINAEYTVKIEELTRKRNDAITKAQKKYETEMAKLEKDKKEKLEEVDREVVPWLENYKSWRPAFSLLTRLRASRGLPTNPKDFGPGLYVSSASSLPNPNSDRWPSVSSPTAVTSSTSSGLKRKASDSTLASCSTSAPGLRVRDRDSDDRHLNAPAGPHVELLEFRVERDSIRQRLTNKPFIFISRGRISLSEENVNHMQTMISNARFAPTQVRADETGYYIVFEGSSEGDREAASCFDRFRHRKFRGVPMEMDCFRRDGSRISAIDLM